MTNADFVHVHCHTEFSRFDGLAKMGDFVSTARRMGFRALGISDHGNVGGWIKFYLQCKTKKVKNEKGEEVDFVDEKGNPVPPIKPIFAEEFYLARQHDEKNPDGRKGNRHLLLIAKNETGYKNLCRLSQMAWTNGQYIDPRIDLHQLAAHHEGIICSTACLGSIINWNLYMGRKQQARQSLTLLKDIFGRDLRVECMYHGIDAEGQIIPDALSLAAQLGIDEIATNDCHMVRKEQARSHEVLMAMNTSRCIKDPKRVHFPHDEFYLKSAEEMNFIFKSHPKLLSNTVALSEEVEDYLKMGGMRLPDFDSKEVLATRDRVVLDTNMVKEIDIPRHIPEVQLVEELSWEGMKRLGYDKSPVHVAMYKKELQDLGVALKNNKMDFFKYFLIDWDISQFARKEGRYANRDGERVMTGSGRGSGYGSIILRTLGVTYGPDPLKYGLLWERFLAFDDHYTLLDSDWGIDEDEKIDVDALLLDGDDLDEERDVEDDAGGVDRY